MGEVCPKPATKPQVTSNSSATPLTGCDVLLSRRLVRRRTDVCDDAYRNPISSPLPREVRDGSGIVELPTQGTVVDGEALDARDRQREVIGEFPVPLT